MTSPNAASISMLSWNIQTGGFPSPAVAENPDRLHTIFKSIDTAIEERGTDTVCLTDAHHWGEHFVDDAEIARYLGFNAAHFLLLDDARLNEDDGEGKGTVFATNQPIAEAWALDLDTRQGLGVILDIGSHGLQLANVYFDDLSEDVRIRQIDALMSGLEEGVPTVITGDLNMLRPDMKGASISTKAKDLIVRCGATLYRRNDPLGKTIRGVNERRAYPHLRSYGYLDAGEATKEPTARAPHPRIFSLDYALHTDQVVVDDFIVEKLPGSDHRPISFKAHVQ